MRNEVIYTVHIEPAEEGGFIAYFPALPGCFTQGETLEQVIVMAKDALAGFLESLRSHGQPIPIESPFLRRVGFDLPLSATFAR
jgi:predicted RNase H-like HicB family nuclease